MGCVSSTNFAVLINGSTTSFFKSSMGLRQGSPLPPYLFLLVAEGLNREITYAKRRRLVTNIKLGRNLALLHLLFMNDVLCFCLAIGRDGLLSWISYNYLMRLLG
jgi:hypothetical protein